MRAAPAAVSGVAGIAGEKRIGAVKRSTPFVDAAATGINFRPTRKIAI
jgi:hypothetical protein